jgi:ribosome-associated toxin RatA of RatAB toxin-antitoxin module
MPTLDLTAHISAPVDLVYQVVADVEQYPTFLPDVTKVERRDDIVAMTLQIGLVPTVLVTRARFTPGQQIDLEMVEGPFRCFRGRWTFTPRDGGTDVAYHADYELPVLGMLLSGPAQYMLQRQTQQQIRAFQSRILQLAARQ